MAVSLAAELEKSFGITVDLISGSGGIFDVMVDGVLLYSKGKTGRFPEPGEVSKLIKNLS